MAERIVTKTNGIPLAGLVNRRYKLRATYKRKRYSARLRPDGQIRFRGKLFRSPSAAGYAITKRPTAGWGFWLYERAPGDWIKLNELRR